MSQRTCSLDYCDSPHRARGYCMYHYKQAQRGTPLSPHVPRRSPGSSAVRDATGRKMCGHCCEWLSVDRFTPSANSGDGLQSWCSRCAADYMLQRRYGIRRDDIDAMLVRQGGCAICGATSVDAGGYRNGWHVDHDHSCCPGDVSCGRCLRGVLCARCNKMIGLAGDDADLMRSAIDYLSSAF